MCSQLFLLLLPGSDCTEFHASVFSSCPPQSEKCGVGVGASEHVCQRANKRLRLKRFGCRVRLLAWQLVFSPKLQQLRDVPQSAWPVCGATFEKIYACVLQS